MINVIASIKVKEGKRSDFLKIFNANLERVRNEDGCIGYFPAVDTPSGLPQQLLEENVVTIIEKWESLDALYAHLKTPHMQEYREKTKDMVDGATLKILQDA